jgi:hypothetical protein
LQEVISVKQIKGPWNLLEKCLDTQIPKSESEVNGFDTVLHFIASSEPDKPYLAYSAACGLDTASFRSSQGVININTAFVNTSNTVEMIEE